MKSQNLCRVIAKQNLPLFLSFLAPSIHNPAAFRLLPTAAKRIQHRSITSSRCLLTPEASATAIKEPNAENDGSDQGQDTSSRPIASNFSVNTKPASLKDNRTLATEQKGGRNGQSPHEKATNPRWGAPMGFRRPSQLSEKQAQINDLLNQTTRPPSRWSSAELVRERSGMMTPTARRQEELARRADLLGPLMIHKQLLGDEHRRIDPPLPVRLDAYMGRGQAVDRDNLPLGRAMALLKGKLTQNQVRAEMRKQKFHERPGLRRKRLKSERWRKRFMVGFKHMIAKVKKMKAQGW